MTESILQATRNALQVQDAVNLSGILRSMSEDVAAVAWELGTNDPAKLMDHPVVILYWDKLRDLLGESDPTTTAVEYYERLTAAYRAATALTNAEG